MLKMLRFDLYKILKSKAVLSVFIVSVCLAFLDPIFNTLIFSRSAKPLFYDLNQEAFMKFWSWIFVIPFVCKDLSSKYIKNVYPEYSAADKIYYVLSKVVYIFAICVIWFVMRFLSQLTVTLIKSGIEHVPFEWEYVPFEWENVDEVVRWRVSSGSYLYFCQFVNCFAQCTVCLFLSFLFKKEYFALLVVVSYPFISHYIYNAIDSAAFENICILGTNIWESIKRFTVYGMLDFYDPGVAIKSWRQLYTQSWLTSLGYSVLFSVLSGAVFVARRSR